MRFAKAQEKKMGKPETVQVVKPRGPQKSPISKIWISMLGDKVRVNIGLSADT